VPNIPEECRSHLSGQQFLLVSYADTDIQASLNSFSSHAVSGTVLVSCNKCAAGMCWCIKEGLFRGLEGARGGTVATQCRPDLQESTVKQNSAVCILGVNKIAPKFVTLVVTYIYMPFVSLKSSQRDIYIYIYIYIYSVSQEERT